MLFTVFASLSTLVSCFLISDRLSSHYLNCKHQKVWDQEWSSFWNICNNQSGSCFFLSKSQLRHSKSWCNIQFFSHLWHPCKIFVFFLFFNLSNISKLQHMVSSDEQQELLMHLYYHSAFFTSVDKSSLSCFQALQNVVDRVLRSSNKWTHMTPILYSLHWLQ